MKRKLYTSLICFLWLVCCNIAVVESICVSFHALEGHSPYSELSKTDHHPSHHKANNHLGHAPCHSHGDSHDGETDPHSHGNDFPTSYKSQLSSSRAFITLAENFSQVLTFEVGGLANLTSRHFLHFVHFVQITFNRLDPPDLDRKNLLASLLISPNAPPTAI